MKTTSHSKNIETNLSLSPRNEPLIPINSNTLLRTYCSRCLSLPLHIRIFTHQPRTCPLISPYQRANRCALSHSFIPAFPFFHRSRSGFSALAPLTPPYQRTHRSTPSPTNSRKHRTTSAQVRALFYRGNGAVLPYDQIVAPMLSEGMYGGIGEKSIEYPRKVYRVSEESL